MTCPPEHLHRAGCYQNHKCRCDQCHAYVNALGRKNNAKRRARIRAGNTNPRPRGITPIFDEDVARLTRASKTTREIAEQLGCTTRTVERARKRLGIAKPAPHYIDDQQRAQARLLIADRCPPQEIAETLGCSVTTVKRNFPEAKMTREEYLELLSAYAYERKLKGEN